MIQISTRIFGIVSDTVGDKSINGNATKNYIPTGTNTLQTTGSFNSGSWTEVPTGSCVTRGWVFLKNIQTGSYMDIAANDTSSTNVFSRLNYNEGLVLPPSASCKYYVKGTTITGSFQVRSVEV